MNPAVPLLITLGLGVILSSTAFGSGDDGNLAKPGLLPVQIRAALECEDRMNWEDECTFEETRARWIDLDGDGEAELFLAFLGGSCGRLFYIFRRASGDGWGILGQVCSLDIEDFRLTLLAERRGGFHTIELVPIPNPEDSAATSATTVTDQFVFDPDRGRYTQRRCILEPCEPN